MAFDKGHLWAMDAKYAGEVWPLDRIGNILGFVGSQLKVIAADENILIFCAGRCDEQHSPISSNSAHQVQNYKFMKSLIA